MRVRGGAGPGAGLGLREAAWGARTWVMRRVGERGSAAGPSPALGVRSKGQHRSPCFSSPTFLLPILLPTLPSVRIHRAHH